MNRASIKKQNRGRRELSVSGRSKFRTSRTALLFFGVGAASFSFASTAFADCWPPLNAIEERDTQTTTVGGVPFTTGFHSWHVPHYHVGNLHCEESIRLRNRQWSFIFGDENSQARWLLKTPEPNVSTPNVSTPPVSTPFAQLSGLEPVGSLPKNLSSLQPAPALAPLPRQSLSLPELPSLSALSSR